MEKTHIINKIIDELHNIDVILTFLSSPANLGGPDGEEVGAIMAQSGASRIGRILSLIEQLEPI